jgi:hypothetical protein
MAFKDRSTTASVEAIAELTNLGRQNYQFPGRPFQITQFALHDKEINYHLLSGTINTDEDNWDIASLPILEPNPDDTDNKYDEDLFPGTLQTEIVDYGYVPYLTGNQLTDEEIQARLKKFYIKGSVEEFSNSVRSSLPGIVLLVQSDISTFDPISANRYLSSTATFVSNESGVFDIQGLLETASINIIPQSPAGRSLVFSPPVYKITSMSNSIEDVKFVATEVVGGTTHQLAGAVYDTNGNILLGENISVILNPYPSVPEVDGTSGRFSVSRVPSGISYSLNLFNGKYVFRNSNGSLSGYSLPNLASDFLNLNFTATPISIYPLKITGRVIDENGQGVGGLPIHNSQNGTLVYSSIVSGKEGQFEIANLSGNTHYVISVHPEDPSRNWEFKTPKTYVNSSFSSNVTNVSFTAVPYQHTINIGGQIVDQNSTPVPNVRVTISPAGKMVNTDGSGNYLFTGVSKSVKQDIVCHLDCYSFVPSVKPITVAAMAVIADNDLLSGQNFTASGFSVNIFGSITKNSLPLTQYNIRKEGMGTMSMTFVDPNGDYTIPENVTLTDYVLIPYSNDPLMEYDFTPQYRQLNSFTGSSTGIVFSASSQNTAATTYTLTGHMYDEKGNQLSRAYVKPWVNRKSINMQVDINDSQRIEWIDNYTFKLHLQRGNYYISLEGDGYKPVNFRALNYTDLSASLTATFSATIDAHSYMISGYVYEKLFDSTTVPFANQTVTMNGRTAMTNTNGYYYFTDVINSSCTLPAKVVPLSPQNMLYSFSPTGYSYNATSLSADKSNVNFIASPEKGKKIINLNIIREDGGIAVNPINFVINNQPFRFGGNAAGVSFLVPESATVSTFDKGFEFSSATIAKPMLVANPSVTDDIQFGTDFARMQELRVYPINFSISSFTASTTSLSLTVVVQNYSKVSGSVWYGATATPYDVNKQGSIYVHLYDGSRDYRRLLLEDGTYSFDKIQSLTGTGAQWYSYLEFSNYHSVTSYNGAIPSFPYNYNEFRLSSSANNTDNNFLTVKSSAVSLSGTVRSVNGTYINGVTLRLNDSSTPVPRDIVVGSSGLGSGQYEFLVPTGSVVNSLFVSSSQNNQQQITNFFNNATSATVYSMSSGITANTVVNWTYRDPDLQFVFKFAYKDFTILNQNTQLPTQGTSTQQSTSTPIGQISSFGSSSLYGAAWYATLINDSTYSKFLAYFDQYLRRAVPPIVDDRKMHWTFGGIYVLDVNTGMCINHWNIVQFLTSYYQQKAAMSISPGTRITTSTTPTTGLTGSKTLPATLQFSPDDLLLINDGYSYEDIVQLLEKHYDLIYLVVDMRNMEVIQQGNYGTQNIGVGGLVAQLNSANNLNNYSIHGNGYRWTVKYFDSNTQQTVYVTPPGISDSIVSRIYGAAPTDPAEISNIKRQFGVDFNISTLSLYTIVAYSQSSAGTVGTGSGTGTGTTTPLSMYDFGGFELKEGDIKVHIYEVVTENPNLLIEILPVQAVDIVCGMRKLPNTGVQHKYVLDGTTHPGLQKGKKYLLTINFQYDDQPTRILYGHKGTPSENYWVVYSSWDSGSTNSNVVRSNPTYDTASEQFMSITKLDNTNDSPSYEYEIGLYPRPASAPARQLTSSNFINRYAVNSCHASPPTPSSTDNYWIAYFLKFIHTSTTDNFASINSLQEDIRSTLLAAMNDSSLSYQEKENAIDSHLTRYANAFNNIFVKSIIAYRANHYQRYYQYETSLNFNQIAYMTTLRFVISLPQLIANKNIFNGYQNALKYSVNTNDGITTFEFNKTELKNAINTWVRNSVQPLTLTIQFLSENSNASDSMSVCLNLVGSGSKIVNVQTHVAPQGVHIANKNFSIPRMGGPTSPPSTGYLYTRQFSNYDGDANSNDLTNKFNFVTRTDMIYLDSADVASFKTLIDSEFVPFRGSNKNEFLDYDYTARNRTLKSSAIDAVRGGWLNNINDWMYLYDRVFSQLPTNTATKWTTILKTQSPTVDTWNIGIQTVRSPSGPQTDPAFENFIKIMPNTIKYMFRTYLGAYVINPQKGIFDYTEYGKHWLNSNDYNGMVSTFVSRGFVPITGTGATQFNFDYQSIFSSNNVVISDTLIPPIIVPSSIPSGIDGWSSSNISPA